MREEIMAIMKQSKKKGQYSQHLNLNESFMLNDMSSQRSRIGNQQMYSPPEVNVDIMETD